MSNRKEEIMLAVNDWKDAVSQRNVDKIMTLYHDEAVLWGTLSDVRRSTALSIREYFVSFLSHDRISAEFTDNLIRIYGEIAINTGYYTFTWYENGNKVIVNARFSFVYKHEGRAWKILDHHSSLIPELPFKPDKYTVAP